MNKLYDIICRYRQWDINFEDARYQFMMRMFDMSQAEMDDCLFEAVVRWQHRTIEHD